MQCKPGKEQQMTFSYHQAFKVMFQNLGTKFGCKNQHPDGEGTKTALESTQKLIGTVDYQHQPLTCTGAVPPTI